MKIRAIDNNSCYPDATSTELFSNRLYICDALIWIYNYLTHYIKTYKKAHGLKNDGGATKEFEPISTYILYKLSVHGPKFFIENEKFLKDHVELIVTCMLETNN